MEKDCKYSLSRRQFVGVSAGAATMFAIGGFNSRPFAYASTETDEASYKAGNYTAKGVGKKSEIVVEVAFSNTAIESIEIVEHGETPRIAQPAFEQLPKTIIELQSLNVDTVTGATLSSMGVLNAIEDCVKQADGDVAALKKGPCVVKKDEQIDIDCDLLVIGAGMSGMGAALTAAQLGAKVIVFEKSSSMGGNALVSGGFFTYANAPEELRTEMNDGYEKLFEEILQANLDAGVEESVIDEVRAQWDEYYATGTNKVFSSPELQALHLCTVNGDSYEDEHHKTLEEEVAAAWLDDMQFPWEKLTAIPGYSWPHWSRSSVDVNGEGYFNLFEDEMSGLDLQILYATPANKLLVENKTVIGAEGVSVNGTTYTVHAKDGVVLASGGYANNLDMLKEHDNMWGWEDLGVFHCDNNFGHDGDGIQLALEAGAAFKELPNNHMIFPFVDTIRFAPETTVGITNESVYINKQGVRFCDEGDTRYNMTVALMQQEDSVAFQIVDSDSSMITDGKTHTGMDVESAIKEGILFRADDLEELANLIEVDKDTFLATIESYNTMVETFEDVDFGRTSFGPNAKIDTPPYYASPRTWAMHITLDGIDTDDLHRALDTEQKPIEKLYVVGEASCGDAGIGTLGAGRAVAQKLYEA